MNTLLKIVAFPAFVSSRLYTAWNPNVCEQTGWDGRFDLDNMYRRGYIFSIVVWAAIGCGAALLLL